MLSVRGVVFLLVLAVVIYFGGLILMPPAILVLPFSLALYRKMNDQSIALFFRLVPVRLFLYCHDQVSYVSLILSFFSCGLQTYIFSKLKHMARHC